MHSRIIQIENHPVDEIDRITEHDYIGDHWFVYSIADYVAEDENTTGTLDWFRETLLPAADHVDFFNDDDGDGFVLREGFHAAFMKPVFEDFHAQLVHMANTLDFGSFISDDMGAKMFGLSSAYDDKYGFYIQSSDLGLVTLNRFLRYAKPDEKYYFGGTVDYHC